MLRFSAILWGALGAGFLARPVLLGEYVNLFLPTTTARIHLRASHGGLALGIALFFWLAADRPSWHRPALVLHTTIFWGLAIGGLLGVALEGRTIPRMVVILMVAAILGTASLRTLSRPNPPPAG